tara:strand:+ start:167 stop:511 length:345 start_codon:yes stop_codon:yes gene_type:complete
MLLGLVLFMAASPALAVNWKVVVYDSSSHEERKFTPPGNVEFKVPLPKSKWTCVLEKAEHNKKGEHRWMFCETPEGYKVATVCTPLKGVGYATLALISSPRKHKGYAVSLYCDS